MTEHELITVESLLRSVSTRNSTASSVKLTSREGAIDTVRVRSLPELVKLIGYLKYAYNGHVYFRGQQQLYSKVLQPTRLRGSSSAASRSSAGAQLGKLMAASTAWTCSHGDHSQFACREKSPSNAGGWLPGGIPKYAVEGLLQHYGIRTRWIDVVDNLMVALWFACHRLESVGRHAHLVRESLSQSVMQLHQDADGGVYFDEGKSVFILCLFATGMHQERSRGLMKFENATVLDLRRSAPSYFTRPHAQHGLLMRPRDDNAAQIVYLPLELSLHDALTWLGTGTALSPYGMFPPAADDDGYRQLLDRQVPVGFETEIKSSLLLYGPGY